jgi:hypothetical protein
MAAIPIRSVCQHGAPLPSRRAPARNGSAQSSRLPREGVNRRHGPNGWSDGPSSVPSPDATRRPAVRREGSCHRLCYPQGSIRPNPSEP